MNDLNSNTFVSISPEETTSIAKDFAASLERGQIILLKGDLGSGKTIFVKAVAQALGLSSHLIQSPTYTYVRSYPLDKGYFVHFDLYRLKTSEDFFAMGFEDYLLPDNYAFIEWPDIIEDRLPDNIQTVSIQYEEEKIRKIRFN